LPNWSILRSRNQHNSWIRRKKRKLYLLNYSWIPALKKADNPKQEEVCSS